MEPLMIPAWRNGRLEPIEKLAVHREGLRHKAVSVFVLTGTEVLLQQRALGKYHTPGLWTNTCCTHPGWNEEPRDCAVRRLREELGIVGLTPSHRERVEYRAEVGDGLIEHELVDIFVAVTDAALELHPDPAEVMDTMWMEMSALTAAVEREPQRFTPWLKIYLAKYHETIFGTLQT